MSEIVGHAPLLLGLLLNNQNNNSAAALGEAPFPGTVVIPEQVAEVDYLQALPIPCGGKLPGTVVIHEQVAEVDYLQVVGHAPLLLGLQLANQNNIEKSRGVNGTVVIHEQVAEVDYLQGKAFQTLETVFIRLRAQGAELTEAQCAFYKRNGYVILPEALAADEAAKLLQEARGVIKRVSEGGEGITKHDVSGSGGKELSPIGRVLATFEPGGTATSDPFGRPIARLGCGIHQKLPRLRSLTHSARHRSITQSLGYSNPRVTQSQLIVKSAGLGGRIIPHQDGCVSFTNPPSCLTFWYALEDATITNGCLCVAAGSHLTAPLRQRLIKGEGGQPRFEDLDPPLWARGPQQQQTGMEVEPEKYEYQPLEVKKGTLVLFHGNLMHRSETNRSAKSRIAYTFSVIEGAAECPDDIYMKPVDGTFESL